MKRDLKSSCLNSIKRNHCQAPLGTANTEHSPPCCLNVGPASKTVGSIEIALRECPLFAGRAHVWCTEDSVMTAIIAAWRNLLILTALETTINYTKTSSNMLLNTNITFLERNIKYFIA